MSITRMRESFSHILRPIMWLLVAVFGLGAIFVIGMPALQSSNKQTSNDEVLVTINGQKISKTELTDAYMAQIKSMGNSAGLSPLQNADMMLNILNQIVLEKLKLSAAEKQGLGAGYFEIGREKNKMIDDQIEYIRTMAAQGKKIKPTDAEIDAMLKRVNPPTSIAQIRSDMKKQLTKDKVRDALLVRKLEDKAKAKVGTINDQKVEQVYQQFKVRHILIRDSGMPGPQTERRANEVLKKLQAGDDFATVARQFSDDPTTKSKGGEIGWIPAIQDTDLQGLSKGKMSGVIKSPMYGGYRIVMVEDVRTELPKDYVAKKAEYRKQIQSAYEQQEVQKMYAEIQKTAKVEIKNPELKGYWIAAKISSAPSPDERAKAIDEAIASLQQSITKSDEIVRDGARSKIGELYMQKGDIDQAIKELDQVINVQHAVGSDLSIMLGKLYMKKGDTKKAIEQLELAGDIGYGDPSVHTELKGLWKQVGQPQRVAQEDKWLADYETRMKAAQQPAGGRPAPTPGG